MWSSNPTWFRGGCLTAPLPEGTLCQPLLKCRLRESSRAKSSPHSAQCAPFLRWTPMMCRTRLSLFKVDLQPSQRHVLRAFSSHFHTMNLLEMFGDAAPVRHNTHFTGSAVGEPLASIDLGLGIWSTSRLTAQESGRLDGWHGIVRRRDRRLWISMHFGGKVVICEGAQRSRSRESSIPACIRIPTQGIRQPCVMLPHV